MTVTREQAQMLTALAIACRPHRAPTWDVEGVMSAIGRVKDRSLPEVALAVIRAAADREAITPGVIPSNGSHWQEQLKPDKWEPSRGPWCGTCGQPIDGHSGDHDPEREPDNRRTPDAMAAIVGDLRTRLQPTTTPTPPVERAPNPDGPAARARAAITAENNEGDAA